MGGCATKVSPSVDEVDSPASTEEGESTACRTGGCECNVYNIVRAQ